MCQESWLGRVERRSVVVGMKTRTKLWISLFAFQLRGEWVSPLSACVCLPTVNSIETHSRKKVPCMKAGCIDCDTLLYVPDSML